MYENARTKLHTAANAARNATLRAQVALGSAIALSPVAAFAQTGPDTGDIESKMTEYGAAAVALVIAFAVVLWGMRAAGLLKPRG